MKVLVPTAGSIPAKENVKYILNIVKKLKAELLVLHIVAPGEKERDEASLEVFNKEGKKLGVPVWRLLWSGDVVTAITTVAEEKKADLIIMGASPGKVVEDWIGSTVAKCAETPVVIIPHEIQVIRN